MTPLETAQAYVAENRPWCRVTGLLEDTEDYFVVTELLPGQEWPLGPAAMLISKESGELRLEAYGNVMDQVDAMSPVQPS